MHIKNLKSSRVRASSANKICEFFKEMEKDFLTKKNFRFDLRQYNHVLEYNTIRGAITVCLLFKQAKTSGLLRNFENLRIKFFSRRFTSMILMMLLE